MNSISYKFLNVTAFSLYILRYLCSYPLLNILVKDKNKIFCKYSFGWKWFYR